MNEQAGPAREARIRVNGAWRPLAVRTVAELLASLGYGREPAAAAEARGIAVAVNGEVVPRSRWRQRALAPGDEVEVVEAVQGG